MDCNVHNPYILGQTYPERRIKHYSSSHKILLVGEGDFSFSSALANAFGFAGNMVATSLDSREKVVNSYTSSPEKPCKSGQENLQTLERLGAMTLHGVDVRTMDKLGSLRGRKFDRIVYNFPHAGFFGFKEEDKKVLKKHRHLVTMFFKNARTLLSTNGEIHVTHQEQYPYNQWKLTEQAQECGLILKESVKFRKSDYPGYTNRRGAGPKIGDTFGFRDCRTYMYIQRESMGATVQLPKLSSKAHAESLEAAILELESEKKNIAKQLKLKEDEIKKKDIRFRETLLKLDIERQARKAAETAQAEVEASLNYFKTLADEALKENSELVRQRELVFYQMDSAWREKTNLAKQLSFKEDEIKKSGIKFTETLLKLGIEKQARKAAESAKSEVEASFNNFKLSVMKKMNKLERQRDDALYQKEEVCREKEKSLRERKDPIQSKWKSNWR